MGKKFKPRKKYPRRQPKPTVEETDYNELWTPLGSDAYLGYKPWYIIDAEERMLEDVAKLAAKYILGQHQPTAEFQFDTGCRVIITNVQKVRVPGREFYNRMYNFQFKNRPAAAYQKNFWWMITHKPRLLMQRETWWKMPHTFRNRNLLESHLFCYPGPIHPHTDQKPIDITAYVGLRPRQLHRLKHGQDTLMGSITGHESQNYEDEPLLYK